MRNWGQRNNYCTVKWDNRRVKTWIQNDGVNFEFSRPLDPGETEPKCTMVLKGKILVTGINLSETAWIYAVASYLKGVGFEEGMRKIIEGYIGLKEKQ